MAVACKIAVVQSSVSAPLHGSSFGWIGRSPQPGRTSVGGRNQEKKPDITVETTPENMAVIESSRFASALLLSLSANRFHAFSQAFKSSLMAQTSVVLFCCLSNTTYRCAVTTPYRRCSEVL